MKHLAIVATGLVLAACEGGPGMPTVFTGGGEAAPVDPARQAQFVALVEQSGCRVDPRDHQFVHDAGFTDLEIGDFGSARLRRFQEPPQRLVSHASGVQVTRERCCV